ncbi:hypothetical protein [Clostridium lacusfryxellense]|uniref:hypothetical protein n=1 Tax=Clostridium lacusfryxellense TaxID=205328 RepID=UPI001C0B57BB|nr:hypothetical protein [Clostridium lacusfryxellense]MBU3112720.1 hypothetical protein [Clostridium lacusfryxellense]
MGYKKNWLLISLLALVFMITSCSSGLNFSTIAGQFSKTTDKIAVEYNNKSAKDFYASLDFDLTEGKVEWEIVNSKNDPVFKGYILYENGKTYRELTYPLNYMNGDLNSKEEVLNGVDVNGNKILDFAYLQFDTSISGKYNLKLNPINAVGTYKLVWSDKLPRK